MKVVPVPMREDNYAYLLIDNKTSKAAAVDPYTVSKVKAAADQLGVQIVAAITTHHHFDHSGGNQDFAKAFPGAPIYGGSSQVPALTEHVKDESEFMIGENIHVKCLATPCHTKDSVCYYATDRSSPDEPGSVFTGDTLFTAGCGRFFEGTGEEMHRALSYLATLPDATVTYAGHEYTASNLKFALSVDSQNQGLKRLQSIVETDRVTTGLTTIRDEKEWNPFMRLQTVPIKNATGYGTGTPDGDIMDKLRTLKNNFKG
ncbi:Metallo-hydrolase/oxidoreductase [Vararia minispora EC-137]|uniref:Metallo-hydrolase/oxidoreductase n=1 Tax=Vararia minispora EC-137 TaxID=1314806 RepID=A0ACB8QW24_9AGAM|nr:Metallo-hydrolase/oxidoreductase [Vararia minispora EC-137]